MITYSLIYLGIGLVLSIIVTVCYVLDSKGYNNFLINTLEIDNVLLLGIVILLTLLAWPMELLIALILLAIVSFCGICMVIGNAFVWLINLIINRKDNSK